MEKRRMVLRMMLGAAGLPALPGGDSDRAAAQGAVYLIQEAGLRMGYGFEWSPAGPRCAQLDDDLTVIAAEAAVERGSCGPSLREKPRAVLGCLHGTFREAPKGSGLRRHEWLTALAGMLYIHRRSRLAGSNLRNRFRALMPGLAAHGRIALAALADHGLLGPEPAEAE